MTAHRLRAIPGTISLLAALLLTLHSAWGDSNDGFDKVSHTELAEQLKSENPPFILDVRGVGEYRVGHIPEAVHIPHTELAERIDELDIADGTEIVVYCEGEHRARKSAPVLEKAGFSRVRVLAGGMGRWRKQQHPVVEPDPADIHGKAAGQSVTKTKTDKLVVHFFGASTCGKCMKIKRKMLSPLATEYDTKLDLHFHDINKKEQFELLLAMNAAYSTKGTVAPQMLYVSDRALTGFDHIMDSGEKLIREYLSTPERWYTYTVHTKENRGGLKKYLRGKAEQFSILAITAAGLADGLNPCAIATIIFLISFLTTQKRKRSEVLAVGLSFTFAVYVTYLSLGIGAFKGLVELEAYHWLSEGLRWAAIALAAGVGIFCFIDAARYSNTEDTRTIRIQLPDGIKSRIHNVIKSRLSGTQLIVSAIMAGFLVTLLEAVCTGQVYLPTIVLMTKSDSLRAEGWMYLLFYCFLFVLPLLITMVLAYFGMTWQRLSRVTKKHLAGLKILLGVVLVALAVFLFVAG